MLSYWLWVFHRSLATFAEFIGNNWVGFAFSFSFAFRRTARSVTQHFRTSSMAFGWQWHYGQLKAAMMKTDWKAVVAIPVLFWFGHALQIAFDDQQFVIRQRDDLRSKITQARSKCDEEVTEIKAGLNHEVNQLKEANAGQRAALDVLSEQARSERNTIDNFGAQLIKAVARPLLVTPLVFDKNEENVVAKKLRWVVLTNKAEGSQKVRIVCTQPVQVESVAVLGGGGFAFAPQKLTPLMWDAALGYPWTPTTPLLVAMSYGSESGDFSCSFDPR
jgi:hypothetical protein